MTDATALSAELERACLHALRDAWGELNYLLFRERMRQPHFALFDGERALGRWTNERRLLELSRPLLLTRRWTEALEVLKHEMAHQYVSEVLFITDETAHGAAFRKVCEERGIDARAAGEPVAEGEEPKKRHVVLERVAKLLALATSSDEHEAQSAMNAAQRLMLQYNLDEVAAKTERNYVSRELGEPTGRLEESLSLIGIVLSEHFFVEVIQIRVWRVLQGQLGSVLEVTGTADNVSMAEYVFSFLHHTAEALWSAHKREHGIRGDRDRRAFRAGVVLGFLSKLRAEKKSNDERGLVWVGDAALNAHHRKRYPRITTQGSRSSGNADARSHGHEAGSKIVLAKGLSKGPEGKGPKLLGGG